MALVGVVMARNATLLDGLAPFGLSDATLGWADVAAAALDGYSTVVVAGSDGAIVSAWASRLAERFGARTAAFVIEGASRAGSPGPELPDGLVEFCREQFGATPRWVSKPT